MSSIARPIVPRASSPYVWTPDKTNVVASAPPDLDTVVNAALDAWPAAAASGAVTAVPVDTYEAVEVQACASSRMSDTAVDPSQGLPPRGAVGTRRPRMAEAEAAAQRILEQARQGAAAITRAAIEKAAKVQQVVDARQAACDALEAECAAIAKVRAEDPLADPDKVMLQAAGGCSYPISRAALQKSARLQAWLMTDIPGRTGGNIPGITPDELQWVIEFLETDKIVRLKALGKARLLKVAESFGGEAMESYVQDPREYASEQFRARRATARRVARLQRAGGAAGTPEGYIAIPAGNFMMDSSWFFKRPVTVTVAAFLLKERPVTEQEWDDLMADRYKRLQNDADLRSQPMPDLAAFAYCNALSLDEGLTECYDFTDLDHSWEPRFDASANGYRLPSEEEWEYAARAGTTDRTYADASRPVNAWGLRGMMGGRVEWTSKKTLLSLVVRGGRGDARLRARPGTCWHLDDMPAFRPARSLL